MKLRRHCIDAVIDCGQTGGRSLPIKERRCDNSLFRCFGVSLLAVESHAEGSDSGYTDSRSDSRSDGELMLSLFAITGL